MIGFGAGASNEPDWRRVHMTTTTKKREVDYFEVQATGRSKKIWLPKKSKIYYMQAQLASALFMK